MLISYWSWFESISSAFLYALYPTLSTALKSNPCKFVLEIWAPIFFKANGANPSSPPWKGTVNLSWLGCGPVTPAASIDALNEPVHVAPTPFMTVPW